MTIKLSVNVYLCDTTPEGKQIRFGTIVYQMETRENEKIYSFMEVYDSVVFDNWREALDSAKVNYELIFKHIR